MRNFTASEKLKELYDIFQLEQTGYDREALMVAAGDLACEIRAKSKNRQDTVSI